MKTENDKASAAGGAGRQPQQADIKTASEPFERFATGVSLPKGVVEDIARLKPFWEGVMDEAGLKYIKEKLGLTDDSSHKEIRQQFSKLGLAWERQALKKDVGVLAEWAVNTDVPEHIEAAENLLHKRRFCTDSMNCLQKAVSDKWDGNVVKIAEELKEIEREALENGLRDKVDLRSLANKGHELTDSNGQKLTGVLSRLLDMVKEHGGNLGSDMKKVSELQTDKEEKSKELERIQKDERGDAEEIAAKENSVSEKRSELEGKDAAVVSMWDRAMAGPDVRAGAEDFKKAFAALNAVEPDPAGSGDEDLKVRGPWAAELYRLEKDIKAKETIKKTTEEALKKAENDRAEKLTGVRNALQKMFTGRGFLKTVPPLLVGGTFGFFAVGTFNNMVYKLGPDLGRAFYRAPNLLRESVSTAVCAAGAVIAVYAVSGGISKARTMYARWKNSPGTGAAAPKPDPLKQEKDAASAATRDLEDARQLLSERSTHYDAIRAAVESLADEKTAAVDMAGKVEARRKVRQTAAEEIENNLRTVDKELKIFTRRAAHTRALCKQLLKSAVEKAEADKKPPTQPDDDTRDDMDYLV